MHAQCIMLISFLLLYFLAFFSIFYKSIQEDYYLSQINFFALYENLFIIFIKMEDWTKLDNLLKMYNDINIRLIGKQKIKDPIVIFDDLLYVFLFIDNKLMFEKTLTILEKEALTHKERSSSIFKRLASVGIYCILLDKIPQKKLIISSLLKISNENPLIDQKLNELEESYDYHLDEGFFLTHAIGVDHKIGFTNDSKDLFKKEFYLGKITLADKIAKIVKGKVIG